MISVICFSKDRPLQLEAYLQSLTYYSGLPLSHISVLYAESPKISYSLLRRKYPQVNWRLERDFRTDLLELVRQSYPHVLLGCDDVFFTDHFDINIALERLISDSSLFGFSLRLGLNLHSIPEVTVRGETIEWDWTKAAQGHWSYPWEVSASVYRRVDVETYIAATPECTNPNRFESLRAKALSELKNDVEPRLASFLRGKCLTLTVNRVQDEFPNEFDGSRATDIDTLYAAHLNGQHLDWPSFHSAENKIIHVDAEYFRLCNAIVSPPSPMGLTKANETSLNFDARRLRYRILFWRYVVRLKEAVRPYLPRKLMTLLRRVVRR